MVLEGGRINALAFSFGPQGLVVAQQGVPIPAGSGLTTLNQALAPSRLTVRFGASEPLGGGAAAAVFEIVNTADVPGAGAGTLRLRFGGATSFVSLAGFPVEGGGGVPALVVLLAAGVVGGLGFLALAGWSRRRPTWSL